MRSRAARDELSRAQPERSTDTTAPPVTCARSRGVLPSLRHFSVSDLCRLIRTQREKRSPRSSPTRRSRASLSRLQSLIVTDRSPFETTGLNANCSLRAETARTADDIRRAPECLQRLKGREAVVAPVSGVLSHPGASRAQGGFEVEDSLGAQDQDSSSRFAQHRQRSDWHRRVPRTASW